MLKVKSILAIIFSVLFSTGLCAAIFQHYQDNEILSQNGKMEVLEKELKYDKATFNKGENFEATQRDNAQAKSDKEQKSDQNSVLKTSSAFITIFVVLVNYLFSGPLESQSINNH